YGREDMLAKAAVEYRAALKFTPNDSSLRLGLGNTLFSERQYQAAVNELQAAGKLSPGNANIDALLARAYANLQDRDETLHYVRLAEQDVKPGRPAANGSESELSEVLVSTGEALNTLGDENAAMERFSRALNAPRSNRVSVRLAIAQVMAQQGHSQEAEREIALAWMEAEAGDTSRPSGAQYIEAADVFRSLLEDELSQSYLGRARAAGAPDEEVRIGLADNDLALGETARAEAELSAISPVSGAPDYQLLMAEANVFRQKHENAKALTAFAQASNAAGDDQAAVEEMLQTGADEGLRVTPYLSVLSDFSVAPVFEDSTVYVLDSKLDGASPVPSSDTALLPPPRSSMQTQWTDAYHLHLNHLPAAGGFYQLRNARGLISVPSTSSVINRDTTDNTFNFGLSPTIHLGDNVLTFNSGIQGTVRRDSRDPVDMNQNLFRLFTYASTSSFFNAVSVSGYVIRESGPFTESNLHSSLLTGAVDFRVGAPWGKTALLTGWGASNQSFSPTNIKDYYTASYVGLEHKFPARLNVTAVLEDLRSWRVFLTRAGIAQDLRPAGSVDFTPKPNWDLHFSSAYSNTRGFHVYDAIQNGFSISYSRPFRRMFSDNSGAVPLQYPIRFSAGFQQETFFNFSGAQSEQFRPYVEISIF
ncbi:MAG: tetratricopeptide repeat protein, partial [Terriglobia bacterium]